MQSISHTPEMSTTYVLWLCALTCNYLAVFCSAQTRRPRDIIDCNLDVVFVLDDSSSIWGPDFEKEKEFVREAIHQMDVGMDKTHIGIMAFSDRVNTNIVSLGEYANNPGYIGQIVYSMKHHKGKFTNTDKALKELREKMFLHSRKDVPNIGVIITDGNSSNTEETKRQAALTKDAGITLFAIGVGNEYNLEELHDIASRPQYTLQVKKGFGHLKNHLDKLKEKLCRVSKREPRFLPQTLPGRCELDVVFVLDDSRSILRQDFEKQKQFVGEAIDRLNVGSAGTQVGVMAFSDRVATDIVSLGDHVRDPGRIKQIVLGMQHHSGRFTNTDEALKALREKMFINSRPHVPDIGVIITDGKSSQEEETKRQATLTKNAGIQLFAIGVGHAFNSKELHDIASSDQFVLEVRKGFSHLSGHLQVLEDRLCRGGGKEKQKKQICRGRMDVLFSAPDEAGVDDMAHTLEFIKGVIQHLRIGRDTTHVGMTPRLADWFDDIALKDFYEVERLEDAIDLRALKTTHLSRQLRFILRSGFSGLKGGRSNAVKVAVLIVDNDLQDCKGAIRLASELKNKGVILLTIGVGAHVNSKELQMIASSKSYKTSYMVRSYEDLRNPIDDIAQNLCNNVHV